VKLNDHALYVATSPQLFADSGKNPPMLAPVLAMLDSERASTVVILSVKHALILLCSLNHIFYFDH
jgi:hypothetical protein